MQNTVIVIKRPWIKWVVAVGVVIGIIVAMNTGFNPKADHQFTVRAVQFGVAFWVLLGVVIYSTKGVEFKHVKAASSAEQEQFDPEREKLILRQQIASRETRPRPRSLSNQ
jgi:hypothetical protein